MLLEIVNKVCSVKLNNKFEVKWKTCEDYEDNNNTIKLYFLKWLNWKNFQLE